MKKTLFIVAALILGGLVWGGLDSIHPFGDPGQVAMDNYFIDHALVDRSAENVVTSIVFDFRGFDTIGEAAVLFTAVCSVTALFREGGKKK
ncbi:MULTISPECIES: hydrogen gas-evolving membrane-bound hydrogenase subunit E [Aminobacterium]|uniref:hydrogen gas-evolving membrane-bound hydrogenase subunit E n=1 Tax=Aminobacterium TaxID=81466 RepID=UPI000463C161|nr:MULTISPECIES: hydrogen gas-evolving membrane-bound hydrogenase subunit E [Aminobacterium]